MDAVRPCHTWLRPSSNDVREGKARGRAPGVSVWDRGLADVAEACALSSKTTGEAFGMTVDRCVELGRSQACVLAIVHDPLDDRQPEPGWDGHALLEGMDWPGSTKRSRRALREALVAEVVPIE